MSNTTNMHKFYKRKSSIETIVIINDAAHITGGAGKVALSSAVALSRKGFQVILFTGIGPIDDTIRDVNLKIICLYQQDILHDPNRLRAIKQGIYNTVAKKEFENILKTLSPKSTVIHFHSWSKALSGSLFTVTHKLGFKIIITLHEYCSLCPNGGFFNYKRSKICHLKPMSIKCCLCNCDNRSYFQKIWRILRQWIQNRSIWKNNITYITISNLNRKILEVNLKIGNHINNVQIYNLKNPIELNTNIIVDVQQNNEYLFIGRLSAEKGIELFCKAITELNLKGTVLGDGYLLNDLKKRYPNIQFAGWLKRPEMEQYIRNCRALVFPSLWYEGAPLTVIEMKSYGIPCIVPNQCSASEEIIDGITGYIFESGNYESLKNSVKKVQINDMSAIANNIIRQFTPFTYFMDTHIEKLLNIYRDVLD
jgi:glycosyltransferase involved in cell wall biosynthesis